jgi:hypothetical protein
MLFAKLYRPATLRSSNCALTTGSCGPLRLGNAFAAGTPWDEVCAPKSNATTGRFGFNRKAADSRISFRSTPTASAKQRSDERVVCSLEDTWAGACFDKLGDATVAHPPLAAQRIRLMVIDDPGRTNIDAGCTRSGEGCGRDSSSGFLLRVGSRNGDFRDGEEDNRETKTNREPTNCGSDIAD